ncbi:hypothetical protein [Paenibacillus sp. R14(2021)]|uniref:hypothetical protein n=1 Tax=Paenibacillus sp. R14(2021) TaxID=2859228 RepID=UPI001C615D97|nr:hypothetical protein [Paenibacillus sp. R14(2021)]
MKQINVNLQSNDFLNIKTIKLKGDSSLARDSVLIDNKLWSVYEDRIQTFDVNSLISREHPIKSNFTKIDYQRDNIWFYNFQLNNDVVQDAIPLSRYNLKDNKFVDYLEKDLHIGSNLLLYDDGDNALLAGGPKVYILNYSNQSIRPFKEFQSQVTGIYGNDSFVWFGTAGEGLIEYNKQNNTFKNYDEIGVSSGTISEISFSDNRLIFNTGYEEELGLTVFDLNTNKWTNYQNEIQEYTGDYWVDQYQTIWVSVNLEDGNQELMYLDLNSNRWKPAKLKNVLLVYDILSFDSRIVLFCTDQGVFQLNKLTGETKPVIKYENDETRIHRINANEFIIVSSQGIYKLDVTGS